MTADSPSFRSLLGKLLPGLEIEDVAAPSGQRVVYFVHFKEGASDELRRCGPVVLKVSEQLNPNQVAYLQKETRLLTELKSAHYPKLIFETVFINDPDTDSPLQARLFVSIEERIAAVPLSKCKSNFQSEPDAVELLTRLVQALDLLWSRPEKIVHRDLKPDNILVKSNGEIVIIDLGIVREEGHPGVTDSGMSVGPCSPAYASPEQARNDKLNITFKSDLFSIGTMIYELVSGSHPFMHTLTDDISVVLSRVLNHHPEPLFKIAGTTQLFSDFVQRIMKKNPFERHRTIDAVKHDLKSLRGKK